MSQKILNPKTGRWVKVDGRIGKALLKATPVAAAPLVPSLGIDILECVFKKLIDLGDLSTAAKLRATHKAMQAMVLPSQNDMVLRMFREACRMIDRQVKTGENWFGRFGNCLCEYFVQRVTVNKKVGVQYNIRLSITGEDKNAFNIVASSLDEAFEHLFKSQACVCLIDRGAMINGGRSTWVVSNPGHSFVDLLLEQVDTLRFSAVAAGDRRIARKMVPASVLDWLG